MVEISVQQDTLRIDVLGAHKVWALKSNLEVPLASVKEVAARPDLKLGWWHGWRLPGTHLPGVIVAGSYLESGDWSFWDVRNPKNTVEIKLEGQRYQRLLVEVADPDATLRKLQDALATVG